MEESLEGLQLTGTVKPKHSGLGLASFITCIVVGVLTFILFVIGGVLEATTPGGLDEESAAAIVIGLSIIALMFLYLTAMALGIAGLFQKGRKKIFAILGTIFSSVAVLLTTGVIILGLLST